MELKIRSMGYFRVRTAMQAAPRAPRMLRCADARVPARLQGPRTSEAGQSNESRMA
jgi:hypothetical protein